MDTMLFPKERSAKKDKKDKKDKEDRKDRKDRKGKRKRVRQSGLKHRASWLQSITIEILERTPNLAQLRTRKGSRGNNQQEIGHAGGNHGTVRFLGPSSLKFTNVTEIKYMIWALKGIVEQDAFHFLSFEAQEVPSSSASSGSDSDSETSHDDQKAWNLIAFFHNKNCYSLFSIIF